LNANAFAEKYKAHEEVHDNIALRNSSQRKRVRSGMLPLIAFEPLPI